MRPIEVLSHFLSRIAYRFRQLRSVLCPKVDENLLAVARNRLPREWRKPFDRLLPSEKAHVLRLFRTISSDPALEEDDRSDLLILALTHDIGKSITRPSLFERIVKALLPIPNRSHPILGARILRRLGAPPLLVRRIARHHLPPGNDRLLKLFQGYDNFY